MDKSIEYLRLSNIPSGVNSFLVIGNLIPNISNLTRFIAIYNQEKGVPEEATNELR